MGVDVDGRFSIEIAKGEGGAADDPDAAANAGFPKSSNELAQAFLEQVAIEEGHTLRRVSSSMRTRRSRNDAGTRSSSGASV